MSEIKTSCPVCKQHISLDSSWTGKEATCPTCGNRFTVPPTAPPLITEIVPPPLPASPPRSQWAKAAPHVTRKTSAIVWVALVGAALLLLLFIGAAAAGLFVARKMKLREQRQEQMLPPQAGRQVGNSLGFRSAGITNVNIDGTICGAPVRLTTGNMNSHAITLSEGTGAKRHEILLFLFLNGASPEGRKWILPGPSNQQQPKPHIHFRCPSSPIGSGILASDYEMTLAFENDSNGRIPATVELNEPGKGVSLKGSFELVKDQSF